MSYYAHTLEDEPPEKWQLLEEHLTNVSQLAADFCRPFGAEEWGRILGLWHDIGKYRPQFQDKLLTNSSRPVDHKGVGARWADEQFRHLGRVMAYCIGGHHGGLSDCGGACAGKSLEELLEDAVSVPKSVPETFLNIDAPPIPFTPANTFQMPFLTRMLFSALVDADFLDTERFMNPDKASYRLPGVPMTDLLDGLNARLSGFSGQGRINELRMEILGACRKSAHLKPGLFTLSVPTGGGKTLSSMAFALDHAVRHGLRRIIYVIPYTSIIEQNAKVFRDCLPADSVIEHHCNFDEGAFKGKDEQNEAFSRHRLACENWDASVVVTTNVQFFESLFAAKTSRCRKLHNLAKSVIILDEAQMLPVPYLAPCLRALETLASDYGSSIVLCTATQPALNEREEFKAGLHGLREIAPDPDRMHKEFARTRLVDAGTLSLQDVAKLIVKREQVLCIVNTRKRASELFDLVREEPGVRHLSALMCPAHRTKALDDIRNALAAGEPCRVVSTQLVEAGVDVSFPAVIREMAGLDSITQAAGRCNREGESEKPGEVTVFMPEEGLPPAFARAAGSTQSTLRRFDDPFSPQAIEDFFSETYWLLGDELDKKQILAEFKGRKPNWQFRTVADKFRLIENDMVPIIVRYDDEAEELIRQLEFIEFPRGILRRLQQYTVQIYRHQLSPLDEAGAIEVVADIYPVLVDNSCYHEQMGLVLPDTSSGDHYIV